MAKPVFLCPNCNNNSTFEVEVTIYRDKTSGYPYVIHDLIRCDVCGEITYQIRKKSRVYLGGGIPSPNLEVEELFQYPFGYTNPEKSLPLPIRSFYIEAYNCFKIGAIKAAAAMCRATISAICDDKGAGSKNEYLKDRIDKLQLSDRIKETAKHIKWIGDKTLHNEVDWAQVRWDKSTVEEMLVFIDRMIDDLYTQERRAKEFGETISKAKIKPKKL